jgi:sulfopyruvate decarboxylase subunit beta
MNKTTAISTVISATTDQPVIFTTGYSCRIARHIADRPSHFYMTGSMGLAAAIATGIAMTTGRTAVAVDGDGSLMMNPTCLVTAGAVPGLRLVHIVLDDASYASTGGQRPPAKSASFVDWARACGYPSAFRARDRETFAGLLDDALGRSAPTLIHCLLSGADDPVPPRIDLDLAKHRETFTAHIRAAHGPANALNEF